jgi:isoleucyl-tRNA synthetase
VRAFTDFISQEVQAVSLEIVSELTDGQEVEFDELVLVVKVAVV